MQYLNAVSIMVPWHNTFFRCEFMRLDRNHSREDPGGLTVCHKSGWTSGWFKTSYISKRNMVSGIPRCRLPFAQDQAPCSTPSCSHSDPASVNQRKCLPALQTICYFCHTLALFYLLGSYFSGHTAELWDVAQLYHSLLCCHPADENTRLAPSWLPVLSQFLTTRRFHNTPHSRICCSRRHLWPCHLCPHQHPLCMGCTLLYAICCWEQRLPTRQVPCCDYTATDQGVISADSGPCCTAQNESEKELDEMSPLRQLRILSRSYCTGPHLALSGRELEKNTFIVQYCSFPTAYREASICHEPMKARTFHGSCQLVMVVTLASCLGSGRSKCNCRLYLSDSSLYHQFYCIAQNQF